MNRFMKEVYFVCTDRIHLSLFEYINYMKKFLLIILFLFTIPTYAQIDNIQMNNFKKLEKKRSKRFKKGSKTNFGKKRKIKETRKINNFYPTKKRKPFSYIKEEELNICSISTNKERN